MSTLHWVIKIGTTALNNGVPRLPQRITGAKRTVRSPFKPTTLPHAGLERRAPTLRRPYRSGAAKWMPETDRRAAHYKLKDIRMSAYKATCSNERIGRSRISLNNNPEGWCPADHDVDRWTSLRVLARNCGELDLELKTFEEKAAAVNINAP